MDETHLSFGLEDEFKFLKQKEILKTQKYARE